MMVESEQWGPVIVTGDFNGHLGPTWGSRAHKNSNILLGEVLDRCKLHAVSLGEAVSGPDYTYHSGKSSTTVDYILADVEASSCVESCEGRLVSGPAYDAKCALRRKFCSAMEERKRVQRQESLFRSNSHLCFRTPQSRSKSKCTRLRVNGTLLSDPSLLLQAWTQHFQSPRGNKSCTEAVD